MITEIDEIIQAQFDEQGPGVAVAVVRYGEVIHRNGYGLANLEWNCAIAPDTVFRLASITKPFTAAAILLLEKQGKLKVDDPITEYLPDYPTQGRTISIAHLLTHTSGIKSYTGLEDFFEKYGRNDLSHEELIALFKDVPLEFEPGERFNYCNSGYYLLGVIIEKLSAMSYGEFVREHIFKPLEMEHSYYMDNEAIIPHRASGYRKTDQGYQHAAYISMKPPYAAGSLGSTIEDLVRWDAALREERLLDKDTQERMYTPTKLTNGETSEYGFGWGISNYHGHKLVSHSGGIHGFSTFLARFLDDATTVIVLVNQEGFEVGKLIRLISCQVLGISVPAREAVSLDEALLDKVSGAYTFSQGFTVDVVRDGEKLSMQGGISLELMPLSETTFYASSDEELEVHFSDLDEEGYKTISIQIPLISAFLGTRTQQV